MMIENGDIFLTRYHDEEKNKFPGYWNHAAIYNDGMIIEALMRNNTGVHTVSFEEWEKGVDQWIQLRLQDWHNPSAAEKAGKHAVTMLGLPYRMVTSVFRFIPTWRVKKGVNCVAVVRLAYKKGFGGDPRWLKADDIREDRRFYAVNMKK